MRVRIAAVTTAAVAFGAGAVGAASAGADHRLACASKGSRTVVATERARIFTKRAMVRPNYPVLRYHACMYRYNRRFRLATVGEPGVFSTSVGPIRLAGRFVAYSTNYEGPAGGDSYAVIRVRDLRSGVEVVRVQAGEAAGTPGIRADEQSPTPDLELTASGSVAWIELGFSGPDRPYYRVRRHDSRGAAVLDEGPDVDPGSLALSGRWLYWTRAGRPVAAELR